jgi:hypothetical protein
MSVEGEVKRARIAELERQNAALRSWLRDVTGADPGDTEEALTRQHAQHLDAVAQNAALAARVAELEREIARAALAAAKGVQPASDDTGEK